MVGVKYHHILTCFNVWTFGSATTQFHCSFKFAIHCSLQLSPCFLLLHASGYAPPPPTAPPMPEETRPDEEFVRYARTSWMKQLVSCSNVWMFWRWMYTKPHSECFKKKHASFVFPVVQQSQQKKHKMQWRILLHLNVVMVQVLPRKWTFVILFHPVLIM